MAAKKGSKEALGKGIKALLQNIDTDINTDNNDIGKTSPTIIQGLRIPLEYIEPNPDQPRKDFDEDSLDELANSIAIHDVIQPITVTKINDKKYQIIAGERRWRAAIKANLDDIPVYIRDASTQDKLEWGLLENLEREDLNAIEIALAYKQLIDECELTQEQLGERMNRNRSTITNYLRLLRLPPNIQAGVRNGDISMGHARVISGIETVEKQLMVYDEIITKHLSVRQVEQLASALNNKRGKQKKQGTPEDPELKSINRQLEDYFGTRTKVNINTSGKGKIQIDFYSKEDLERILRKLQ